MRPALLWVGLLAIGFVAGALSQARVPSTRPQGSTATDQHRSLRTPDTSRAHTVAGRVTTASGIPIRHAFVTLLNKTTRDSVTVTSDDGGLYSAGGLADGNYRVTAKKSGFVSLAYGQAGAFDEEKPVVLSGATTRRGVDFKLPKAGTITGSVTDDRGEPVADVAVGVQRFDQVAGRRRLVPALPPVTTDDRGTFRLTGVPPGSFLVSAVAGGVFRESSGTPAYAYAPTYHPSTAAPEDAGLVVMKEGSAVGLDVRLVRTPIVTQRGVVTSSSGRADRTGFVRAFRPGSLESSGKVVPVSRDGSFSLDLLGLPGSYILTAVLGVAAPANVDRHSEIARATIQVGSAATGGLPDIRMTAEPGAVLRGKVSVEGGALSDVGPMRIFLQPIDADDSWPPNVSVLTGPDGGFELRNVLWPGIVTADLTVDRPWRVAAVFLGDRDITNAGVKPAGGEVIEQIRVVLRKRTEGDPRVSDRP